MANKRSSRVRVRIHLTVVVVLLYEVISEVIAVPVVVSGGAAPISTVPLQNQDGIKILTMPIWARKAGGNWKPELVQELIAEPPVAGNADYVLGQNEKTPVMEAVESEVKKRVEKNKSHITNLDGHQGEVDKAKSSIEGDSTEENEDQYQYEYDELLPEEQECPEEKFWHIRGLKCVPYDCPGGNAWRDRDTGDCILKHYGYRNRWRSRPWRP